MSDNYYDRKGIRHFDRGSRDNANNHYLNEEREAREKLIKHQEEQSKYQKQQAEAQAAQLELVEQQDKRIEELQAEQERHHRRQEDHNTRLEILKRQQALAEAHERAFQHEVEWLKNSDNAGKFEYLARGAQEEAAELIFQALLEPLDQALSQVTQEWSSFISATDEFVAAQAERDKTYDEWKALNGRLRTAKQNYEISGGFTGCASLILVVVLLVGILGTGIVFVQHGSKLATVCGIVAAFAIWCGFAWDRNAQVSRKNAKEKKTDLASKVEEARQQVEATKLARQNAIQRARSARHELMEAYARASRPVIDHFLITGEAAEILLAVVKKLQNDYPTACRCDLLELPKSVVQENVSVLGNDIATLAHAAQQSAIREHVQEAGTAVGDLFSKRPEFLKLILEEPSETETEKFLE